MKAAALVEDAAATLRAAGVREPGRDAERLLRHVLGWDQAALLASPAAAVPAQAEARFRALVARRAAREPLQYVIGVAPFWRHELLVTPAVLIPRPETELLVEAALEQLRGVERPRVVDVGTGSGCVALSIAAEREDALVHATDVSGPALDVARENARRLGLAGRVAFHEGPLLEPVAGLDPHLVVSNPPYVDPADRDSLEPEVRDHEPPQALFPPGDVLSVYRSLAPAAATLLVPGGALAVEVSPFVAGEVERLFAEAGFEALEARRDLARRTRVVLGRLPASRPGPPAATPVG